MSPRTSTPRMMKTAIIRPFDAVSVRSPTARHAALQRWDVARTSEVDWRGLAGWSRVVGVIAVSVRREVVEVASPGVDGAAGEDTGAVAHDHEVAHPDRWVVPVHRVAPDGVASATSVRSEVEDALDHDG